MLAGTIAFQHVAADWDHDELYRTAVTHVGRAIRLYGEHVPGDRLWLDIEEVLADCCDWWIDQGILTYIGTAENPIPDIIRRKHGRPLRKRAA